MSLKKRKIPDGWKRCKKHGLYFPRSSDEVPVCHECVTEAERIKEDRCLAKLGHGPGHQSKTYCEVIGPHEVHECSCHAGDARWKDPANKIKFTGYFDEVPYCDDDDPTRRAAEQKRFADKPAVALFNTLHKASPFMTLNSETASLTMQFKTLKEGQAVHTALVKFLSDTSLKTS